MVVPKITRHLRMIQFPDTEDEDDTLNGSQSKSELSSLLDKVMELVGFLIDDTNVSKTSEKTNFDNYADEDTQAWELVKCLIGLLEVLSIENLTSKTKDNPNLEESDDTTSMQSYKDQAIKILTLLCKLHYTAVSLMEYASNHSSFYDNKQSKSEKSSSNEEQDINEKEDLPSDDTEDLEVLPLLGLGCLSYLLLAENVDVIHIPQVFRFDYFLRINLECISCLLQRTNIQINHKGLELLSSLLEKIEEGSLEHYFLKYPRFLDVPKALINIMAYSTSKTLRKRATNLLLKLITKLNTRGRYVLLRYLLLDCSHAGVGALLIHSIKEEVHRNLNSQNEDIWFRGTQLISLLRPVFKLPQGMGMDVDLVPETERIMASLNCIRYILLRDREDKTTLWKSFTLFENDFLDLLREAIKVTRVRYQAVQKQKEYEAKGADNRKDTENKIDFTVATPDGTPINEMSQEDQIQVLRSGLYALDMMDCIIAHIAEIINSRR